MVARAEITDGDEAAAAFSELVCADPVGAACLMRLLHLQLAWGLQAEHSRLKGRSPIAAQPSSSSSSSLRASSSDRQQGSSGQQDLAVDAYHEGYLSAVGAPTGKLNVCDDALPPPLVTVVLVTARLHQWSLLACHASSSSSSSSAGTSAATAAAAAPAAVNLQQQLLPHSCVQGCSWQTLETVAVLPTLQQLLLLIEAALLHPAGCCRSVFDVLMSTLSVLRVRGCLEAAVAELLPPVLQQLSLAVRHVVQHPEQLDGPLESICSGYAGLVAALLAAGEAGATP
jgi:hypothetical protein